MKYKYKYKYKYNYKILGSGKLYCELVKRRLIGEATTAHKQMF